MFNKQPVPLHLTVTVEDSDNLYRKGNDVLEGDYRRYAVLRCNGEEIWRNNGEDWLGRDEELAADIVIDRLRQVFRVG